MIKKKKLEILSYLFILSVLLIPLGYLKNNINYFESDRQDIVNTSAQISETKQWIKNPTFESPIEPTWFWENGTEGDNSDVLAVPTPGQADYKVIGEEKSVTLIYGTPNSSTSPGWKIFNNSDFLPPYNVEMNSSGAYINHNLDESSGPGQVNNFPSVHFKKNVSMPIDMSDYVITNVSIDVVFNASVDINVDSYNDWNQSGNTPYIDQDKFIIGDSANFYVELSDLSNSYPFRVAEFETRDLALGEGDLVDPDILNITDTELNYADEQDLVAALNSALETDHQNFSITLGLDIYCEDNKAGGGGDQDYWNYLIFKTFNITVSYIKKIDQSTTLSWNQIGNKINGSNHQITDANLNFQYLIDQNWSTLAPLSELRVFVNNKSFNEGIIKLSSFNSTYQDLKVGGIDVTSLISTDVNISISIELYLKDAFTLNSNITISIDNVYLNISYIETFPDYDTDFRLLLNGNNKTSNPVFQLPLNSLLNISFKYLNQSKNHITNATIQLEGEVTGALGENITFQQYDIAINTSDLGIGISILTIVAQKNNYETQNVQIFVEVTERITELQLYIDGNLTTDKSTISAKFNEIINVSIYYQDNETKKHISGANVNLLGTGRLNETNNYYNITLNTTTLDKGVNIFTIYAQLDNYQPQSIQFFIEAFDRETELVLKVNNSQKFDGDTIQVNFNEFINISVYYKDNFTKEHITGASVSLFGIDNLTEQTSYYDIIINSNVLDLGINVLSIYAQLDGGYKSQSIHIFIEVFDRETELVLKVNNSQKFDGDTIQVNFNEFINISVYYKDNFTKEHITGASVSLFGIDNLTEQTSYYDIIINSNVLDLGINVLSIYAQLDGYKSQSIQIFVDNNEIETNLFLYVNEKQIFDIDTVQVQLNEIINISVYYNDNLRDIYITGARVSLFGIDNLTQQTSYYDIIINSNVLNLGINILTIYAQKNGYKPYSIQFLVEVFERAPNFNLFLNGENKTIDRVYDLPITSSLNITIKFYDNQTGSHINEAVLQLIGEGLLTNFTEYSALQQYSLILNTSDLNVGIKLFSIIAQATDYQPFTLDIRVTITRITTYITTITGESRLSAKSGQDFRLKLLINNTDFGGIIKGATVSFIWEYGLGELTDLDNDGVYEITLQNVKVGSHIITITAFAGDLYEFETYEIVLNVIAESGLDLTLLVIGLTGGIMGLVSVFIAYQKHFKYPPMVRKVRKLKKKINKGKKTKPLLIAKREDIITNNLQDTLQILTLETLDPKKKDTNLKDFISKNDEKITKEGGPSPN